MIKRPINAQRCYFVSCKHCEITETMIFVGPPFGQIFPTTIARGGTKVPIGYRHMPMSSVDADGNEVTPVFKPTPGLLRDSLPTTCPTCDGELSVTLADLRH